ICRAMAVLPTPGPPWRTCRPGSSAPPTASSSPLRPDTGPRRSPLVRASQRARASSSYSPRSALKGRSRGIGAGGDDGDGGGGETPGATALARGWAPLPEALRPFGGSGSTSRGPVIVDSLTLSGKRPPEAHRSPHDTQERRGAGRLPRAL